MTYGDNRCTLHLFYSHFASIVFCALFDICCWEQIQLLEPNSCDYDAEEQKVVLHNGDWQFCKLVEHLDHAFLHG